MRGVQGGETHCWEKERARCQCLPLLYSLLAHVEGEDRLAAHRAHKWQPSAKMGSRVAEIDAQLFASIVDQSFSARRANQIWLHLREEHGLWQPNQQEYVPAGEVRCLLIMTCVTVWRLSGCE